jgi:hypothetical protein
MILALVELSDSPKTVALVIDSENQVVVIQRPNGWEPLYRLLKGEVVGLPQCFALSDHVVASLDSLLVG